MLTLYYKPTCPFCQRVLEVAENLGISFDLRDISESDEAAEELVATGGKRQVPFLVDTKNGTNRYESSDIIEYLREHKSEFAASDTAAASKPRVHASDSVCEACEG